MLKCNTLLLITNESTKSVIQFVVVVIKQSAEPVLLYVSCFQTIMSLIILLSNLKTHSSIFVEYSRLQLC